MNLVCLRLFSFWAREAIGLKGSEKVNIVQNLFQVSKPLTQEDIALKT